MIELKGQMLKSKMEELTLEEWDAISDFKNDDELDNSDKFLAIIEYLGGNDLIYEIDDDDLFNFSKDLTSSKVDSQINTTDITINDDIYRPNLVEGDFKLLGMDYNILEKRAKLGKSFTLYSIAVIYKKVGASNLDNYNPENIDYKMSLFKNLLVKDYFPYIIYIIKSFETKIKILNEISK